MSKPVTDELAKQYMPLVFAVAKRFTQRGAEWDELVQSGSVGLLKAASGYSENRSPNFAAYAFSFIEGEIRAFLRKNRLITLPRSMLSHSLENGLESDDDKRYVVENGFETVSIETEYGNQLLDEASSESSHFEEHTVLKQSMMESIMELDTIEKKIVQLRYYHSLTQKQTAEIMRVSQSTVSKTESKALLKLKKAIDAE